MFLVCDNSFWEWIVVIGLNEVLNWSLRDLVEVCLNFIDGCLRIYLLFLLMFL